LAGAPPAISITLFRVVWNFLVSSRAIPEEEPLAVLLDRLLEVADQGQAVAERAEDVLLEVERLAAVGADQLLLEELEHPRLELVDQVVQCVIRLVQVPAQALVAGDVGRDPGLGRRLVGGIMNILRMPWVGVGARK